MADEIKQHTLSVLVENKFGAPVLTGSTAVTRASGTTRSR